jgi:hypothetical protein
MSSTCEAIVLHCRGSVRCDLPARSKVEFDVYWNHGSATSQLTHLIGPLAARSCPIAIGEVKVVAVPPSFSSLEPRLYIQDF